MLEYNFPQIVFNKHFVKEHFIERKLFKSKKITLLFYSAKTVKLRWLTDAFYVLNRPKRKKKMADDFA